MLPACNVIDGDFLLKAEMSLKLKSGPVSLEI